MNGHHFDNNPPKKEHKEGPKRPWHVSWATKIGKFFSLICFISFIANKFSSIYGYDYLDPAPPLLTPTWMMNSGKISSSRRRNKRPNNKTVFHHLALSLRHARTCLEPRWVFFYLFFFLLKFIYSYVQLLTATTAQTYWPWHYPAQW